MVQAVGGKMYRWAPLHCHSQYSLMDGLSTADDIADRCIELGYESCALTDHGTLSGTADFVQAMEAKGLKPILGNEIYLCKEDATLHNKDNRPLAHLVVLAKNLQGWKDLIRLSSETNNPKNFYYKPRIQRQNISQFSGNLISFSGHMGSELANIIFQDIRGAYRSRTYDEAKAFINPDWSRLAVNLALEYQEVFGKGNFFIEIQLIDQEALPVQKLIAEGLRWVSKKTGIPCVATADSHYCRKIDADDQRILLCSSMETTLQYIGAKIQADEDVSLGGFFRSRNYHIPSIEEMEALHSEAELRNAVEISDMCEKYSILSPPKMPIFDASINQEELLRQLCRNGWDKRIKNRVDKSKHKEYSDRVKHELEILTQAGLSGYFLIVEDFVRWGQNQGWMVLARGSGAGSLVSYLLGLTNADPLEYDLLFERFYNAGRNTKDRVALPDIDCDMPTAKRGDMIEYIKNKYGHDRVAQICTFNKMMGRGALKDVLRAHDACSFEEMNRITEFIPDESKISDDLQVMEEEQGESSIIKWALENNSKDLSDWCVLKDDGTLEGKMSKFFAQAIRLEGTKRNQSRHAGGIIIANESLPENCPMIYDKKSDQMITGYDMHGMESIGYVKFDCLGVRVLDKTMGVINLLEKGSIE
jgi:DNA polymerase-3 subunit alpha